MKATLMRLALAAALYLASAPAGSAARVVDAYVRDGYKYTCIVVDKVKYCGSWNVASGG